MYPNYLKMKEAIKKIIKKLPFAFTQNQRYDRQTAAVIKRSCQPGSNTIDVGCHVGEVLDMLLAASPQGRHFGFEPIPVLFSALQIRYSGQENVTISNIALSNKQETTSFNYVISNPAYSGLIKRKYDRQDEQDTSIEVQTNMLDTVIPADVQVDFIKIDVEGGELLVLQGAKQTLKKSKPVVIFEYGLGASDYYGTTPDMLYALFEECNFNLSVMEAWLKNKPAFTQAEFEKQYYSKKNYYFIAYPK